MKVINPFDFFIEDWAEQIGFEYPKALTETSNPISARWTRRARAPAQVTSPRPG